MTTQKRFIAGAVCPQCGEMDKIVMFQSEGRTLRECVKCDYQDQMSNNSESGSAQEIPTRVTAKEVQESAEAQPIKFYPSPNKK